MERPINDMPIRTNPDLLTVEEAAGLVRMSPSSLYDAVSRKLITSVRLSGSGRRGKVLIPRDALLEWVEKNKVEAEGGPKPAAPAPAQTRLQNLSID